MSIEDSILRKENALVSKLQEKQTAIDDRTGKGLATEAVIEQELLKPFLPPVLVCYFYSFLRRRIESITVLMFFKSP